MRLVHKKFICFVFVALVIFSLLGSGVGGNAYAATSLIGYSDVLDDLQKDEKFNPEEYPAVDGDYSLQVIQIAESSAGELFVYVYQPAANSKSLTATQINMSLTEDFSEYDYDDNVDNSGDNNQDYGGENGGGHGGGGGSIRSAALSTESTASTYLYDLTIINRNGVFAKYKVSNFTVSSEPVRYYNITSIYRAWVEGIDEPTGNDNTINAVSFPVGKLYTATTVNGGIIYENPKQFVTVTDKYLAKIRVLNGFALVTSEFTDVWFCAFSVDWDMNELYSVDIKYTYQHFYYRVLANAVIENKSDDKPYIKTVCLNRDDKAENNPVVLFGGENYSKNRIVTSKDFISNENLAASAIEQIKNKQWVIRFTESEYFNAGSSGVREYSEVSDVSLLRFNFKSNGQVYNLGVVDNMSSGDKVANNPKQKSLWDIFIEFCKWLESVTGVAYIIWAIIFLAVPILILFSVLSIFLPPVRAVIKTICKGIWTGVKWLFKGLWYVIISPYLLIRWIIDKKNGG